MISVALCTYNGERYIRQQLVSILEQRLSPDEIIICDDRSTDHTLDVINDTISASKIPCHIYKNKINLGYKRNFEKAISLCQGDIIFLSDQDDVWYKNKIEVVSRCFDDPSVMMAHHDDRLVDENLSIIYDSYWRAIGVPYARMNKNDYRPLLLRNYVQGSACAFRKDVYDAAIPFNTCVSHDTWLALFAIHMGKLISLNEPLMAYRQWGKNSMGVHIPTLSEKIKCYRNKLQIILKDHIENLQSRVDLFADLEKRLAVQKRSLLVPYSMHDFFQKRLDIALANRMVVHLSSYYSYCNFKEDTKQLLKDYIAHFFYDRK